MISAFDINTLIDSQVPNLGKELQVVRSGFVILHCLIRIELT